MKIVYITDQVYLHGGVEKVLSQKANYLADVEGYEVYIITYNQQNRKPCYPFSEKIIFYDLGINYNIGKSYFHPSNLKKIFTHKKRLKLALKTIKPDIMVSCSIGPDFYFITKIESKVPKIKEYHASRFFSSKMKAGIKKRLLNSYGAKIEKQFDALIVLNPDEKQYYNSDHIYVIPNPIFLPNYKAALESKKILAAGRISPVKNFGKLIFLFSEISNYFPDWELHIYGEDYLDTTQKLRMQINEVGLEDKIKIFDAVENLQQKMLEYSIYAMTSETECFPMVLLESLSVGLPIISFDCPTGPRHIVKDNVDGYIIPNNDDKLFVQKFSYVMQDEFVRKQLGNNAQMNANHFEISKVMPVWKDLFLSLISKN